MHNAILKSLAFLGLFGNLEIILAAQADFGRKCVPDTAAVHKEGNGTASRMTRNSKFVYLSDLKNPSFDAAIKLCKEWGLEVAEIRHPHSLKVISEYLQNLPLKYPDNETTTYWVSGTDKGHEGVWSYTEDEIETLAYHVFWGYAPMNFPSHKDHNSADNVQLHWTEDPITGKKFLVMMDIDDPNFYQMKSVICQYPRDSHCLKNSEEEKVVQAALEKKDVLENLGEPQSSQFQVSVVQKRMEDALSLCRAQGKQILNLEVLTEQHSQELLSSMSKWMEKNELCSGTTAFWVGRHDLFSPLSIIQWEWVDRRIRDPLHDSVLTYMKTAVREGSINEAPGNCLAIGILNKNETLYHVQRVPCDLPQWVICTDGQEIPAPVKKLGRAMDIVEQLIKNITDATESPFSPTIITTTPPPPITSTTAHPSIPIPSHAPGSNASTTPAHESNPTPPTVSPPHGPTTPPPASPPTGPTTPPPASPPHEPTTPTPVSPPHGLTTPPPASPPTGPTTPPPASPPHEPTTPTPASPPHGPTTPPPPLNPTSPAPSLNATTPTPSSTPSPKGATTTPNPLVTTIPPPPMTTANPTPS